MKSIVISCMLALIFSLRIVGQESPKIKFEKVSMEELSMKTYPNDSTADAVILYDEGDSHIKYDLQRGFILTHERFVRIKVLRQKGVEWGNFRFSVYSYNSNKEEMSHINGTTMNLENGKIVKSELKKGAIFRERENKYWESVKFSMPSVKVGSVMDLQYTIITDMTWNLRTWKFQYAIPVKWSQLKVVYPEYFNYNHQSLGYHRLLVNKNSESMENISYTERVDNSSGNYGGLSVNSRETVSRNISYQNHVYEYAVCDVPAMKEEPYLTAMDNYTTQIKFELSSTDFTRVGGSYHNYTTSWNEIANQLNEEENFGQQLKSIGFLADDIERLTKGVGDTASRLAAIYQHIKQNMKWDGFKSIFTDKNLKKAYADKIGNSADINLLLIAMLRKAGIEAAPVILSTRDHGIISFSHPSISDCNYVVARAMLNNKQILLDATEPDLQPGVLPFRCLNGNGHLIDKSTDITIAITNPKSVESKMVELTLTNGKMTGTIKEKLTGLSAFNLRKSIKEKGGRKEFFEKKKNGSSDMEYLDYKITNLDTISEPLITEYKFAFKDNPEGDAAIIYLDPVPIERQKTNPFLAPTRDFPVDFGVPATEYYNLQFTIPPGYVAEELPKTLSLTMEGKGGFFQYEILQSDQKINVNMVFTIGKTLFLPAEYPSLKKFFDMVINKQAEQIVLKKKAV